MKIEGWKTVRAAIEGWGPTLRLVTIMAAATVCLVVLQLILGLYKGNAPRTEGSTGQLIPQSGPSTERAGTYRIQPLPASTSPERR